MSPVLCNFFLVNLFIMKKFIPFMLQFCVELKCSEALVYCLLKFNNFENLLLLLYILLLSGNIDWLVNFRQSPVQGAERTSGNIEIDPDPNKSNKCRVIYHNIRGLYVFKLSLIMLRNIHISEISQRYF